MNVITALLINPLIYEHVQYVCQVSNWSLVYHPDTVASLDMCQSHGKLLNP